MIFLTIFWSIYNLTTYDQLYLFKRMKKTNKSNKNIINMTSGSTHNTHWVNRFRPYWPILEFRAGSYNPLTLFLWVRSTTQWWTQPISIHTVYCMCMYPVARAGYLYKLVIVRETVHVMWMRGRCQTLHYTSICVFFLLLSFRGTQSLQPSEQS